MKQHLAARPLNCLGPQPAARVRLVCFHHSGGSPAAFRRWPAGLAPDIEVWAVTMPGRGVRSDERCGRQLAPLVDEFAAAITERVALPVALFGHSLGALLAFEVARVLTRAGTAPRQLIVSGRSAPHLPTRVRLPSTDDALLHQLDAVYGGIPEALRAAPELLEYFLPIIRADLELSTGYAFRAGSPLSCPITALAGDADPLVRLDDLAGWDRHTTAGFEYQSLPGGHFYLDQHERSVFDTIRKRLAG